jgi:hypothetical protein
VVLEKSLLKLTSQTDALVSVGLDFIFVLAVLAHLDVLFELFNLPILHLPLEFDLSVLPLELLDKERLQIVGLLAHRRVPPSV